MITVLPTYYIYERQEDIIYNLVLNETEKFCDQVCDTGYITENMMNNYNKTLGSTGLLYDVEFEHLNKIILYLQQSSESLISYDAYYKYDIYNAIESNGIYKMNHSDYFMVDIKNTTPTSANVLKSILINNENNLTIYVRSGGMVRNEAD